MRGDPRNILMLPMTLLPPGEDMNEDIIVELAAGDARIIPIGPLAIPRIIAGPPTPCSGIGGC
jgi:hypothetical protein